MEAYSYLAFSANFICLTLLKQVLTDYKRFFVAINNIKIFSRRKYNVLASLNQSNKTFYTGKWWIFYNRVFDWLTTIVWWYILSDINKDTCGVSWEVRADFLKFSNSRWLTFFLKLNLNLLTQIIGVYSVCIQ